MIVSNHHFGNLLVLFSQQEDLSWKNKLLRERTENSFQIFHSTFHEISESFYAKIK